jgi:hypothetical protein
MRSRALAWPLSLAAVLIALPLSYEWVITVVGPLALYVFWKWLEVMTLAQVVIAAVFVPIVLLTEIAERWPRIGRAILIIGVIAAVLWLLGDGPLLELGGGVECVQGGCHRTTWR